MDNSNPKTDKAGKACCQPTRAGGASAVKMPAEKGSVQRDTVAIPGGRALVGTDHPVFKADGEAPLRHRRIDAFECERGAVTNKAFAKFVEETGYETEAEKFGWSFVFHLQVPAAVRLTQGVVGLEWWRRVDGACWKFPAGPEGDPAEDDHPAVHVSWNDATAYAKWCGGALPTEPEWEHAARGGLGDVPYPWGEKAPDDEAFFPCNIWQGNFPNENLELDGYFGTAPSISFEPNGYGLYNMAGNVWEWTGDPFRVRTVSRKKRAEQESLGPRKLLKGGSYLCHHSYCTRYRIAARTGNTPDSTSSHTGFRVVYHD